MKKYIKAILPLLLLTCLLLNAVSCSFSSEDNSDEIINGLLKGEELSIHSKRLTQHETPYTLCYENSDGSFSVYIFSSPIAYKDEEGTLKLIDTSLTDTDEKEGYALKTKSGKIVSYYPESLCDAPVIVKSEKDEISFCIEEGFRGSDCQKTVFCDLLGAQRECVSYTGGKADIKYVPTSSGTTVNITLDKQAEEGKISFYVKSSDGKAFSLVNERDVLITNPLTSKQAGAIKQSPIRDANGRMTYCSAAIEEEDGGLKYTVSLDEQLLSSPDTAYPVSLSVSFELEQNTLTSVLSDGEKVLDSLSDHYTVEDEKAMYMKFRIGYLLKSYKQNVKSASFNVVGASVTEKCTLGLYRLSGFWRSEGFVSPEVSFKESELEIKGAGKYSADITQYVKACIHDDTLNSEDFGLVFKAAVGKAVLSSYNDSTYKPYVRIDFYDLPWTFESVDVIES